MIYEKKLYPFNSQQTETIKSFGDIISNGKVTLGKADKKQNNLLRNILEFNTRVRPKSKGDEKKKRNNYESINFKIKATVSKYWNIFQLVYNHLLSTILQLKI